MQSIIFAGGKGTRMGELTRDTPKPLLTLRTKPMLSYVLESLPRKIDQVIVVIDYLGDKIKQYFGSSFNGLSLEYVLQNSNMSGTGGALWSAQDLINNEKFLVLNSDDIYKPDFLNKIIESPLAFGVAHKEWDGYLSIIADTNGNLCDFAIQDGKKTVATGAYTLDKRIFGYEPFLTSNQEYSLPRTILKMAKDYPIKLIHSDFFMSINTPEDLREAAKIVSG